MSATPTPVTIMTRQQVLSMLLMNVPMTSLSAQLRDNLIMAPGNIFVPVLYNPTFTVPSSIYTTSSYSTAINYFQNLYDTTKFPTIPRHGMIYLGNAQIVIFQFGPLMSSSPPPLTSSATPLPLINSILYNSTGLEFTITSTGCSAIIATSSSPPSISIPSKSSSNINLVFGIFMGCVLCLIGGAFLYYKFESDSNKMKQESKPKPKPKPSPSKSTSQHGVA